MWDFEFLEPRQLLSSSGTASISGTVFNDADGNGKKSSTETGIAKVTVYLDVNNNKKLDSSELKTTTDSNGNYSFTKLKSGTYIVRQILPTNMEQTTPTDGYGNHVTLKTGQKVTNQLFGDKSTIPPVPPYPPPSAPGAAPDWAGFGGNAQHTALSTATVPTQDLDKLKWQTSVDLNPDYDSDGDLYTHYGSPLITADNTVIVPVKTGKEGGYKVEAIKGSNGSTLWQMTTDYILPPHDWTLDFDPTVTASNRVFFAGAGGTIDWRDSADSSTGASGQIAFYGEANYLANKSKMDSTVFIDTPITADSAGNIYFGIQVTGSNPMNLKSGLVRIAVNGTGTYVSAVSAANNDSSIDKPAQNAAPAISNDGKTVYFVVNHTSSNLYSQPGDLIALDSTTMKTLAVKKLINPVDQSRASVPDDGTASPMIGLDGDVYFGVLTSDSDFRGFMLHFSGDLSKTKTPGSFGWDDTASVVPASMVSSYHGSSTYLIMTKYNNYIEGGGDGINKLAVLDPNAAQTDPMNKIPVMKEVLTIAGVTPDPEYPGTKAVREWCVNTAAVDPATDSILANSEDGTLYRWDLSTNTFTQKIVLDGGLGQAYTPTAIGPDGTVYSINQSTLFAAGT